MWRSLWPSRSSGSTNNEDPQLSSSGEVLASIALQLLEGRFDDVAQRLLSQIGQGFDADRCYIALLEKHDRYRVNAYEWCSPAAETCEVSATTFSLEDFPVFTEILLQDTPLRLNSLDELPEDAGKEHQFLSLRSVLSLVIAPMARQGETVGWLGFERSREARSFSPDDALIMHQLADLFAAALIRQRHDNKLEILALAVEQSPAVVIISDPKGNIEYVNPRFTETSGYEANQAIDHWVIIPEHSEIPEKTYREIWASITAGQEWRGELTNRHKDGRKYWETVSISPVRDLSGTVSHYIAVKEDITDRINTLANLQKAKEEADRANRAKSEFLANMSHEIRTPVNAIIGISHLALQGDLSEKARNHLNKIRYSSKDLLGIINDILDYSKIDSGRLIIESFDFQLDDVLDNLLELLDAKAQAKGLKLIMSLPPELPRSLRSDPFQIGQILINLGNNAVKFTETGKVVISCECVEEKKDSVVLRFAVSDSGIGISASDIGRLFDPFTQVDSSPSRRYGGSGLGLAIARRLVELRGGEIGVTSTLGKGSEFYFTLRLLRQSHLEATFDMPFDDLNGMKILVVDDSRTSRKVLCETLKSFTFKPIAVDSGERALEQLRTTAEKGEDPYELVLMDWKMPNMDGIETSRRIKETDGNAPPIIMITGYGREDIIYQADSDLLDGFLLKPVNPSLLFDAIMNAIGRDPNNESTESEYQPKPTQKTEMGGERILLVEDNALNQEVARELLIDLGVDVSIANNGQEALDILENHHFDVILMDIQMPVMDGFEATRLIRADPKHASIPIVAMTAHAMSGDRERCIEGGMDDYTSKPIDIDHLVKILAKWIVTLPPTTILDNGNTTGDNDEILNIEGINIEAGQKRIGGNKKLFKKLLLDFFHDYKEVVGTVRTALDLGHNESGLRLLHTLKGVAATIGADGVHIAARDLEEGLRSGEYDSLEPRLNNLSRAITPILNALAKIDDDLNRGKPTTTSQKRNDLTEIWPIIAELRRLLDEGDPDAAACLQQLSEKFAPTGKHNHLEVLEQQIDNFDFDEASLSLEKLTIQLGLNIGEKPT